MLVCIRPDTTKITDDLYDLGERYSKITRTISAPVNNVPFPLLSQY